MTEQDNTPPANPERRDATLRPSAIDGSRMIAIASGKGGVGKTWFAVTLAHALARAGRKVLLFDGDLGLANVDIQLGLTPSRDIGQVVAGKISLKQAVTRFEDGGFDIIAGRSGAGSLAALPSPRLLRLRQELSALSAKYDHVVLDLGAGVDRIVQLLSAPAGLCLLIVNDEPTSLTDAYAFLKLAHQAETADNVQVVVNMAESKPAGQRTHETLARATQNFLKFTPPLAGIIRRDGKVKESIRAQLPLLTRSPTSEAGADVERLAAQILL